MADKKNILIIEDDRFLSSLLRARFEKDGFGIFQAFDGDEAIKLLKQNKPNLVLLDLIMPRVSGFEVLEAISLNPEMKKVPVVILSNLAQESDVQKAKQLGAAEYFVKIRVSINALVKKIEDMLAV